MEWYEIIISAVATLGGVGGFISIYKAKPEKTSIEVQNMKEMLGEDNEWGIVTENDEDALYHGIKRLLDDPTLLAHYKEKAAQRGKTFSTANTVKAVEDMLLNL